MNYEEAMRLTGLSVDTRPVEVGMTYQSISGRVVTVLQVVSDYVVFQHHTTDTEPEHLPDRVFRTLFRRCSP